jgi:hypothetical protein
VRVGPRSRPRWMSRRIARRPWHSAWSPATCTWWAAAAPSRHAPASTPPKRAR